MPEEHVALLMEAARRAPTDATLHLWSAVRVRDPARRARIADLIGQPHVAEASEFFVFVADLYRLRELLRYRGRELGGGRRALLLFAAVDAALAAENMALAAVSLGYATCFIGAVQNAPREVAAELELPELTYPLFGLTVGIPDEDPPQRPRLPLGMLFHVDRYRRYGEEDLKAAYEAMAPITRSGDWLKILERYVAPGGYFESRGRVMESLLSTWG